MSRLKSSTLYIFTFLLLTLGTLLIQTMPLFMGLGKSYIDYLIHPLIHIVKPQFIRSTHTRLACFIWTMLVHLLWVKKIDPIYTVPTLNNIAQPINYLKGILISLSLITITQLAFLHITATPYTIQPQYHKLLINIPAITLLSFFTSASEEIIHRQYLLQKLKPFGIHIATIIQALLFGLLHYKGGWGRICSTALAGLFFGYARTYTNSLSYCIGLHTGMHLLNVKTYLGPFFDLGSYKDIVYIVDHNLGGLIGQIPLLLATIYLGFLVNKQKYQMLNNPSI